MLAMVGMVILLALIPIPGAPSGEGAARLYNQGNAAFMAGDMEGAIKSYLAARGQDSEAPRLLYNLGSAYLKAGNLGEAIRHLEMARLRAPRDRDILYNLSFARGRRVDALPDPKASLVEKIGGFPLRTFSENELVAVAGALFIAAFLVMGAAWPRRRGRRGKAIVASGLLLVGLSLFAGAYAVAHHLEYGLSRVVVDADELPVKSAPGMDNPILFTVHAGMEAKVRETRGAWSLIVIPTGFTGWAPNEALLFLGD